MFSPRTPSAFSIATSKSRIIGYVIVAVLCLLQVILNGLASKQMLAAHDNATPNSLAICTGHGMVYIDEMAYLLDGEFKYLDLESSESSAEFSQSDEHLPCIASVKIDTPQSDFQFEIALLSFKARTADNFNLQQNNYLRDTYPSALSRAPPTILS